MCKITIKKYHFKKAIFNYSYMQIKGCCLNKRILKLTIKYLLFTTHINAYGNLLEFFIFILPLSRNRAHFLVNEATSSHNWPKCRSARLIRSCIILALVSLKNLDKHILTSIHPCNKIVFKANMSFKCTNIRNKYLTHTSMILIIHF